MLLLDRICYLLVACCFIFVWGLGLYAFVCWVLLIWFAGTVHCTCVVAIGYLAWVWVFVWFLLFYLMFVVGVGYVVLIGSAVGGLLIDFDFSG